MPTLSIALIPVAGLLLGLALSARRPSQPATPPTPRRSTVDAVRALAREHGWGVQQPQPVPDQGEDDIETLHVMLVPSVLDDVEIHVSPAYRMALAPMMPGARLRGGVLVRRCRVGALEENVARVLDWMRQCYQLLAAPWLALRDEPELTVHSLDLSLADGALDMVIGAGGGTVLLGRAGYRRPLVLKTRTGELPLTVLRRRTGRDTGARLPDPILSSLLHLETSTPEAAAALLMTDAARPVLVEVFHRFPDAAGAEDGVRLECSVSTARAALVERLVLLGELDARLSEGRR